MGLFMFIACLNVTPLGCWNDWHENVGAIQGDISVQ